MAMSEAMKKAKAVAEEINRKHEGVVVIASEAHNLKPPRLSTGSLALDAEWDGGWPVNQWSEIVGNEGSGKTTLALKTAAAAMKRDPEFIVVWVAAESYDDAYAEMLGVDNGRVLLIEENIMEIAYDSVLTYLKKRACDMVVIDSLPALVPADEDAKSMEEWSPGSGARRSNQFMRKATKATKRSLVAEDRPIVGIIINQWREKIGVMHGDPRTTPGGKAKNFWMYARAETKRDEWIIDPDTKKKVGMAIKVTTIKMKGSPNNGTAPIVDFYFADNSVGISAGSFDSSKEILNLAMIYEIVQRRGSQYVYEDVRYRGKQAFYDAVRDDAPLYERICKEVLDVSAGVVKEEEPPIPPVRKTIPRRI